MSRKWEMLIWVCFPTNLHKNTQNKVLRYNLVMFKYQESNNPYGTWPSVTSILVFIWPFKITWLSLKYVCVNSYWCVSNNNSDLILFCNNVSLSFFSVPRWEWLQSSKRHTSCNPFSSKFTFTFHSFLICKLMFYEFSVHTLYRLCTLNIFYYLNWKL